MPVVIHSVMSVCDHFSCYKTNQETSPGEKRLDLFVFVGLEAVHSSSEYTIVTIRKIDNNLI